MQRRRRAGAALVVLALALAACASRRPAVLEPLAGLDPGARTPVVLIPGITGTRLRDPETGRLRWGNGRSLFFPRDGGRSLAVPLAPRADAGPGLEPAGPVTEIRLLGLLKFEFYGALIRLMQANGYRHGDLAAPARDETFFIFGYDWRRGNVRAAAELARQLERLRRVRGERVLRVHLICQSNANRIARYLVKYGGAPLDEAEAGTARPPAALRVGKLILIGTDNGGALATLLGLNRGRSYLPVLGRRFLPEALFGYTSLYESLPDRRGDLFVDARGRALDVDLFDADNWERYGWGIHAPDAQRRLRRNPRRELFGDPEQRRAFLRAALGRARRLQAVLARDAAGFRAPRYYLVHNVYRPTLRRAVLVGGERPGRPWRTLFAEDRRVRRDRYLFGRATAPGDGHATRDSQLRLAPQERAALAREPVLVAAPHRRIILDPLTHRWLLEFLLE